MAILKALLTPAAIRYVPPDDCSELVDGSYRGFDATGRIDRCVGAVAVKETVFYAVAVLIIANYLASVIDGQRIGIESARIIECCVSAIAVEKAVIDAATISVGSDNLSSFVNV